MNNHKDSPPSLRKLLERLWGHIAIRRRCQLGVLLLLMVLASFAEVLSIGAVLPFLSVLVSPEHLYYYHGFQPLIHHFGLMRPQDLLFPVTVIFCTAALVAGVMRLSLLWVSTRLSFAVGSDLSVSIYRRTLYQQYAVHIARNSSVIVDGIINKSRLIISNTITPIFSLVSAAIMLAVVVGGLITFEPVLALVSVSGFGAIYAAIMLLARRGLVNNGQRISRESANVIKALQEGLGGIRDVLIAGTQRIYCDTYASADNILRRAQGYNQFVAQCPRYLVESIGMLLIATLAYHLALQTDGIAKAVPLLGVMALAAQRLLPIMQQAYLAWSNIQGAKQSLHDTLELLDQPLPNDGELSTAPIRFKESIALIGVSFRYELGSPYVLNDIRLEIKRGDRVGFIGTTGSGKSTLLDIVMGLLQPTEGVLEIDGVGINSKNLDAWRSHIAHVPQNIFLADISIAENIAFGVPRDEIDYARVKYAATLAQMNELIESLPQNYQTRVGERGVRLSGGQRQRIGIARAFYKQKDVIIFDEATSALDDQTERSVMQSINNVDTKITLLIIAHRLSTLYGCSKVVEIEAGKVKGVCSYKDLAI